MENTRFGDRRTNRQPGFGPGAADPVWHSRNNERAPLTRQSPMIARGCLVQKRNESGTRAAPPDLTRHASFRTPYVEARATRVATKTELVFATRCTRGRLPVDRFVGKQSRPKHRTESNLFRGCVRNTRRYGNEHAPCNAPRRTAGVSTMPLFTSGSLHASHGSESLHCRGFAHVFQHAGRCCQLSHGYARA